jgi:hypothetical protein
VDEIGEKKLMNLGGGLYYTGAAKCPSDYPYELMK